MSARLPVALVQGYEPGIQPSHDIGVAKGVLGGVPNERVGGLIGLVDGQLFLAKDHIKGEPRDPLVAVDEAVVPQQVEEEPDREHEQVRGAVFAAALVERGAPGVPERPETQPSLRLPGLPPCSARAPWWSSQTSVSVIQADQGSRVNSRASGEDPRGPRRRCR